MIIYKTTNKINNKFYIGKDEKNNPKYLGSGLLLLKAIEKYGKENFIKEILEECFTRDQLNDREKFWIKELNAIELGYNLAEGGTGGKTQENVWNKGLTKDNNDILQRIGQKNKELLTGSVQSEETKKKRADKNRGQKRSKETKAKMRQSQLGKNVSEETKRKLSEITKNKWTPEFREKFHNLRRGKINSEESKQKISETWRIKMANYRQAIEELNTKGTTSMTLSGNSMLPIIKSGSKLNFIKLDSYEVGDIVFCRVKNHYIGAHKIIKKDKNKGYLIANNHGHENGWTKTIYGKVVEVL